jgi:hypothetical protein
MAKFANLSISGKDEGTIMAKFYFVLIGVIIMAVGVLVVRKFHEPANRSGIGSFTLLPLAGFAYLIGILCIVSGSVFMLLGLFMI